MSTRRVYFFGETPENQPANSELCRKVLGGKGISLAAMIKLGMPVPLGFTITCQTCVEYQKTASWPEGLKEEVSSILVLTFYLQAEVTRMRRAVFKSGFY